MQTDLSLYWLHIPLCWKLPVMAHLCFLFCQQKKLELDEILSEILETDIIFKFKLFCNKNSSTQILEIVYVP